MDTLKQIYKQICFDWKYSGRDMQHEFMEACYKGDMKTVIKILKYSFLELNFINDGFSWACNNGHLEVVKYLLTSPDLKEHADIHADNDKGFRGACDKGHLEVVKYLLTSPYLKEYADIHAQDDYGFRWACSNRHLEVVKYLLTSTDLKEHPDIHANDDRGFIWACEEGHLDVVKYLLTSSDINEHANIHAENDYGFRLACYHGHLEVVKYLLTSPELKEHADIHANDDEGLKCACDKGHLEVVKYLIDDFKITKTKDIEEFLIKNNKYSTLNMFNVRDCNKSVANNSDNYCKSNVHNTSIILGNNSRAVPLIKTPKHSYDKPVTCEQFVTNRTKSKKDKVKINYEL